jgi:hypothetical protein
MGAEQDRHDDEGDGAHHPPDGPALVVVGMAQAQAMELPGVVLGLLAGGGQLLVAMVGPLVLGLAQGDPGRHQATDPGQYRCHSHQAAVGQDHTMQR